MLLMQAQENGVVLDEEQLLFLAGGQDNAIDEDVDEQPVQDLALNVDNVFQADDCDAYDSDVDEAPTAQTMFMANLSSADPVCKEAGPSYNLDNLSKVHDHDHFQDAICEHHEEHEMQDDLVNTRRTNDEGLQNLQQKTRQILRLSCTSEEATEQLAPYDSDSGPSPILSTARNLSSGSTESISCYTFAPPTNKDLEMLFQPMFDEYFNPPGIRLNPIPVIPTTGEPSAEVNPFAAADPRTL
ncbi:hypothetical protein Tco_0313492 [Tanacetum coccineum]